MYGSTRLILKSHREWLETVSALPENELPCNVSTVAYAILVARRAVDAYDALLESLEQILGTPA